MVWNSLVESVRSTQTLVNFKHNLNTHLFNTAFNKLLINDFYLERCDASCTKLSLLILVE